MSSAEGSDAAGATRVKKARIRLLSTLVENRRLGGWMLGGGLVYFALSLAGVSLYSCPVRSLTGLRCPGCGMTTGSKELVRGNWEAALQSNLFTPVIALLWLAVAVGLVLPEPLRGGYLRWIRASERLTQWPAVLGIALLIYTLTRNIPVA